MKSHRTNALQTVVAAAVLAVASASAVADEPPPLRLRWGVVETSGAEAQAESDVLKASLAQKPVRAPAGKAGAPARAAYSGGTSMATPLAAGAAALVRQWLADRRGVADPPAALVKALLVNGARDMAPGQYGTGAFREISGRPDRSQGFGHVDLYGSLEPGEDVFLSFETNRLAATGSRFSTRFMLGEPNAGRCAVTLVWQDYPGTEGAGKALVNDLDLSVVSPSGTVYHPNGLGEPDRLDNVEFVEFDAEEAGRYEVRVDAHNIAKTDGLGAQPFALVMRHPKTRPGMIIFAW